MLIHRYLENVSAVSGLAPSSTYFRPRGIPELTLFPMAIKLAAAAAVAVAGGVLYQKLCAARKRIEELEEEVREKVRFSELPAIDDVDGEDYELQGSLKGLLRKVNHYSIVVRDLAQTEWFYCKLLGFEKLNRPNRRHAEP